MTNKDIIDIVESMDFPGQKKHSLMFQPNSGRFPSSTDWNIPKIECGNTKCSANYSKSCVMPSLIKIDAKGKCAGYHPRKVGKK